MINSPLEINGKKIYTLTALQEDFDLSAVLECYKNGELLNWLKRKAQSKERYERKAAEIEALDENTVDFVPRLCAVFEVDYSADMEVVFQQQERIAKLRTYTNDAEAISNIELVAFDQEDLTKLLHSGAEKIYLCGDSFVVPASQKNKCYIGVNNPGVHIGGEIPENWAEQGIEFVGCTVDNLPEEAIPSAGTKTDWSLNENISGEMVDRLICLSQGAEKTGLLSLSDKRPICIDSDVFLETPQFIYARGLLYNKHTGEKKRLDWELLPFVHTTLLARVPYLGVNFAQVENKVIYFDEEQEGVCWFDFANLNSSQKLFSMQKGRTTPCLCACGQQIIYSDNVRGLCVHNMSTNEGYRIPAPDEKGYATAMYAVEDGVYFSWTNNTMYFYNYCSKKVGAVFKTSHSSYSADIRHIYHVDEGKKFFVAQGAGKYGVIVLDDGNTSDSELDCSIDFDVDGGTGSGQKIRAYEDRLIYVAYGGIIKSVDYKTCEITAIADGALSTTSNIPKHFGRLGNWICYTNNKKETYRVSLTPPNSFERVSNIAHALSDQEIKALFSEQDMKELFPHQENVDIRDLTDDMILKKLQENIPVVTIE